MTVSKIAVIINGDTQRRHLENVDRASQLFQSVGYDLYVASARRPRAGATAYAAPTRAGIAELLKDLRGRMSSRDEMVLYTTGHGRGDDGGCLVLEDGCLSPSDEVIEGFLRLPHRKRTVIMSQCYGGNWAARFGKDARTLFISAGSKDEEVCCDRFDPYLFQPERRIPDRNRDGTITWQERYGFAMRHRQAALSVFLPGRQYRDAGVRDGKAEPAHYGLRVEEVRSAADYERRLKDLQPGDVAVVAFATPGCGPCHAYRPLFHKLAADHGGRALFLWVPNGDDEAEWERLPIHGFPTVLLVDGQGRSVEVDDRKDPLAERRFLVNAPWWDPAYCLRKLRSNPEAAEHVDKRLWENRAFVLAAVKQNGMAITYADESLQQDRVIVMAALEQNRDAYDCIDPEMRKDPVVLRLLSRLWTERKRR